MSDMQQIDLLSDYNFNWADYVDEKDGTPFFVKYKTNLDGFQASKKYTTILTANWQYGQVDEMLLPNNHQSKLIIEVEKAMIKVLEYDLQTILYYAYVGFGQKKWSFYSSDAEMALQRLKKVQEEFKFIDLQILLEYDPDWKRYKEANWLQDFRGY